MKTEQELGFDTIKFKFREGCFSVVKDLMFEQGYKLVPKGDGVYESEPDSRRQHEIRVNIYDCTVSFHYTKPGGRERDEEKIKRVKTLVEKHLEVFE